MKKTVPYNYSRYQDTDQQQHSVHKQEKTRPELNREQQNIVEDGSKVGLETTVEITNQPVTQHGMTGIQTKTLDNAEKRRVADKSYYENEMKKKLAGIVQEIQRMTGEIKNAQLEQNEKKKCEEKKAEQMKSIRQLEGQLADFNLSLDKMRSNVDVQELKTIAQEMTIKNKQEKQTLDALFLENKQIDKNIKNLETEIDTMYGQIEKILQLFPHMKDEFSMLVERSKAIRLSSLQTQMELNDVKTQYRELKKKMGESGDKHVANYFDFMELKKQLNELKVKKTKIRPKLQLEVTPKIWI
ncbi:hypothetical protein RFI_22942 [Reticulomyxa filosa]|uniref:Uncharacterized protein n=1 Tax=Reticulomyxa filosa TaxID=46433 RepID=X6MKA7_RETFI|nr:hypothetical protein RFI_22942 [Reticulomyxa filosa]|eukprot:ETO14428.1 hypothetical protein RFI_22942 [Reticulomyxa filosa]